MIIAVAKIKPEAAMESVYALLPAEAKKVWEFHKNESIRQIFLRKDVPGAVILLEGNDIEQAKATVATLPMVEANVLDVEFIPVAPYTNWEFLFAKE
ncbi:hypothetical protein I8748_04290 [Nostoc sp. CENA67]|uniref:Superoxide dismutase n=1 Tax=Amazonocrinis nigriterrae CENA67 TaxID=2794033 RepID=A0A8J7HS86_9NOST|nr:hypothetical protein [Amazonocrinis nigriterrae]MBH8561404.1 hypothetical protein [Amazonocrinis nigriterrae CENA67]